MDLSRYGGDEETPLLCTQYNNWEEKA